MTVAEIAVRIYCAWPVEFKSTFPKGLEYEIAVNTAENLHAELVKRGHIPPVAMDEGREFKHA